MTLNPELQFAYDFVATTGDHLFLTGKAGTGKTTFLRHVAATIPKRMVILAPTGVAAINAGGMTIHSFFQLPFGPYVPSTAGSGTRETKAEAHQYRREKIQLIRSLDLLIIDEISMVRADLLDAVSDILCRYRFDSRPFGGVQLLMIGDVQQLAPVAKESEWQLLSSVYESPYFFCSQALRKCAYRTISLTRVFRQTDEKFLALLNDIRHQQTTLSTWEQLNSRYIPDFNDKREGYITLTTHQAQARLINSARLDEIRSPEYTFTAEISGNFPESGYPTECELVLKKNAQVMFVKNDTSGSHRYFNGKIGVITAISRSRIEVLAEGDTEPFEVETEEWSNTSFTLDPNTRDIIETVEGTFKQIPLKLAWAITIHKSQGLTFDRVIIDAADAFAHGQVYVALSRCRSLEGIVLSRPIRPYALKEDSAVQSFTAIKEAEKSEPCDLQAAQQGYTITLLEELFSLSSLLRLVKKMAYIASDQLSRLLPHYVAAWQRTIAPLRELDEVGPRFMNQLRNYNSNLEERVRQGGAYFEKQLSALFSPLFEEGLAQVDDKTLQSSLRTLYMDVYREVFYKKALFAYAQTTFSIESYLNVRAHKRLDAEALTLRSATPSKSSSKSSERPVPSDIKHPILYRSLDAWRATEAEESGQARYQILTQKALLGIVASLPTTSKALLAVNGVGKTILKKYGDAILEIVVQYCSQSADL